MGIAFEPKISILPFLLSSPSSLPKNKINKKYGVFTL
jgi:hypothetical protein